MTWHLAKETLVHDAGAFSSLMKKDIRFYEICFYVREDSYEPHVAELACRRTLPWEKLKNWQTSHHGACEESMLPRVRVVTQ